MRCQVGSTSTAFLERLVSRRWNDNGKGTQGVKFRIRNFHIHIPRCRCECAALPIPAVQPALVLLPNSNLTRQQGSRTA